MVDAVAQALPGYERQYEQWKEYIESESELGPGDKAQQLVDYQLERILSR